MPHETEPPKKPEGKGGGGLRGLAKRSTGLPADTTPTRENGDPDAWKVAGLGLQFAITIALFTLFGHILDQKLNWSPWGVVSMVLIAVVGNLYLLIKESLKENNSSAKKK
ncbi:MAG: AtpZ/AtpI family protein [Phycisphaerales bacterium]|nr:AtpZ/AtpI family protein [Phycisphaerales bacterium]